MLYINGQLYLNEAELRLGLLACIPTGMVIKPPVLKWGSTLGMVLGSNLEKIDECILALN